jgi:hypothetical protein
MKDDEKTANPTDLLLSLISSRWPTTEPLVEIENPDWPSGSQPWGDWKHYVDDDLRRLWHQLSLESRLSHYWTAKLRAEFEPDYDRS